jgi:polar amino acid transport system permease protein
LSFFEYARLIAAELGRGVSATLIFTLVGMVVGFFVAIPLCVIRLYGQGIGKKLVSAYVEIIRGTPLLVQLYIIYYGFPKFLLPLGIRITPYLAAMVGFIINSTAYQVEYMKGGFKAISYEQYEAARSLGMRKWQAVIRILIPQGLRFSIPALSNELIYLLKYTSLGFVIQAPELMTKAKILASTHARYMETYLLAAFIYIFLTFVFTKITDIVDKRLRIPGFAPQKIR